MLCCNCDISLHNNMKTSESDETIIPTEIIGNYLYKYLNYNEMFLSISLTSTTDDRDYFQEDLISNLMVNSKLENCTYNILDGVDPSRRGNMDVFNLVLIDRSASLV